MVYETGFAGTCTEQHRFLLLDPGLEFKEGSVSSFVSTFLSLTDQTRSGHVTV